MLYSWWKLLILSWLGLQTHADKAGFMHHPKANVHKKIEAETSNLFNLARDRANKPALSSQPHTSDGSAVVLPSNGGISVDSLANNSEPVLLFWAVSAQQRVMSLVVRNVDNVRKHLQHADVFLAHYDNKKEMWLKNDKEWYHQNVAFSAERSGFKFQLMRELLVGNSSFDLRRYSWVWALDEDVDFHSTNLHRMFALADASGALLALPAFTESGSTRAERQLSYPVQQPRKGCQYRYSPVVEVIFPLVRSAVLKLLLEQCDHCIHQKSSWGLNRMWCSWAAHKWNLFGRKAHQACAILDETPVKHLNFKTLKGKYIGSGKDAMSPTFESAANDDFKDVQMNYPFDFVTGPAASIQSWECIRR